MMVLAKQPSFARLVRVRYSRYLSSQEPPEVVSDVCVPVLNDDLTDAANIAVASSVPLASNGQLASRGFQLIGAGFILTSAEAQGLLRADIRNARIVRPYRNGKDLTDRPRDVSLIDFGLMSEIEARAVPVLFDIVRDRVKPGRDANARASYARAWWRFGEPRRELRASLAALERFVVTVETAKHRFFEFLDAKIAPDNKLVCIATSSAFALGVLSSSLHASWAAASGSMLEDKPVYPKRSCFDPFPFPDPPDALRAKIAAVAESLDAHRKSAIDRDVRVTMTGMYNVVAKLRSGAALTPKERTIHELAACGVLRDMHDELDALVAEAYGWPWPMTDAGILDRLVA